MSVNLSGKTLYTFIVEDFATAWDSIVVSGKAGGNFMFARHAMGLLEFLCRIGMRVPPMLFDRFCECLEEIEPRYFTSLPGRVPVPRDFRLPSRPNRAGADRQLLSALFDLIRHGQAHQYQQIPVELTDGHHFGITLTGPAPDRSLHKITYRSVERPQGHLSFRVDPADNVWLMVRPEVLFLDFRIAADRSSLLSGGDDPEYLERPHRSGDYHFDAEALTAALTVGGHSRFG